MIDRILQSNVELPLQVNHDDSDIIMQLPFLPGRDFPETLYRSFGCIGCLGQGSFYQYFRHLSLLVAFEQFCHFLPFELVPQPIGGQYY